MRGSAPALRRSWTARMLPWWAALLSGVSPSASCRFSCAPASMSSCSASMLSVHAAMWIRVFPLLSTGSSRVSMSFRMPAANNHERAFFICDNRSSVSLFFSSSAACFPAALRSSSWSVSMTARSFFSLSFFNPNALISSVDMPRSFLVFVICILMSVSEMLERLASARQSLRFCASSTTSFLGVDLGVRSGNGSRENFGSSSADRGSSDEVLPLPILNVCCA
mmetsp:Transcript_61862/g.145502  ORF Transcript_61862/g.145502 Transcript_61862/m.145502 type:complete len:223 (+) Transcript_61862:112-780(+)